MSTSATGSYFSGESTFSASLNNVISQALARASAPITQLQNQQSTLANEQGEVQTLGNDFMAVQTAIDGLNTAASTSAYSATVDVPTVATATASSTALAGTYTLDVSSLGSQTNTISPTRLHHRDRSVQSEYFLPPPVLPSPSMEQPKL